MTRRRFAFVACAISGGIACSRSAAPEATQPAPPATGQAQPGRGTGGMHGTGGMGGMGMEGMCPMHLQGAHVTVDDTANGVALSFTTANGDVAGLRARVRHMAAMYAQPMGPGHAMEGGMRGGAHGGPYGPGMGAGDTGPGMMGMVPSEAKVVDIDRGARLELTPRDPGQLSALRSHARMHAEQMASGHCPMLDGQPTDSTRG